MAFHFADAAGNIGTAAANVTVASPTPEVCDGVDNDLDGFVDEGFADTDADGVADCVDADDDNDTFSDTAELAAGSDPLNATSTPEVCDGLDNDLDGQIDEGFADTDADGIADCVDTFNTPPTAEAGADLSLQCLEMSCPVILDSSGSTDPDSTPGTQDDIVSYDWYENYGLPTEVHFPGQTISVDLPLVDHAITLVVTDAAGATGLDMLLISLNPARLSLLEISKAEVEWEKDMTKLHRVKMHGKVGMPAGMDFYRVYPVGTVALGISTAADAINESVAFEVKGDDGSKLEYKAESKVVGITKYSINWNGAKFDYNQEIRIKSNHLGQSATTLEIDLKEVAEPITIAVLDATIHIDAAGAVTAEPPTLSVDFDDDGEIEVVLPFAITQDTVFSVSHGDASYSVKVADHYSAAVGKFEMMGQFSAGGLNGDSRPATLDLEITIGDQKFYGLFHIPADGWNRLKPTEWKYKR